MASHSFRVRIKTPGRLQRHLLVLSFICISVLSAASTSAQESESSEAADADSNSVLEEVVVVSSSRIVRDGFKAPTPTTVVGTAILETLAPGMVIDAISSLPLMKNEDSPATIGAANSGARGQSFVNLRGLGANRNLVLFNGQRFVPTTNIGTVDISLIPSAILKRIDIVTGGASAAWGSDAVAGVVNFIIDDDFTGVKLAAQGGVSTHSDAEESKYSVTAGTDFAGDRGSILFNAEYFKTNGVPSNYIYRQRGEVNPRDYQQSYSTVLTNPNAGPGEPQFILADNVFYGFGTWGGLIFAGPLARNRFLPNGELTPFQPGIASGSSMIMPSYSAGEDQEMIWGPIAYAYTKAPLERYNLYARGAYQLTPKYQLTADALYAKSDAYGTSAPPVTPIGGFLTIRSDNAFLSQNVKDRLAAVNSPGFALARVSEDVGAAIMTSTNTTHRLSLALDGSLGKIWTLSAHVQRGENKEERDFLGNTILANYHAASDAVLGPNGEIVCRSALTNPSSDCVPWNVFGNGAGSQAAYDYITGDSLSDLTVTQTSAAASISGDPFELNGVPVSVATGLEWRKETADQRVDPLSEAGGFVFANPKSMHGNLSVLEGFVEVLVPILSGMPLAENLDVNAAYRATDYSDSGFVNTWKLGVNYSPVESLRVRTTISRDIRAPNLRELFSSPISQSAILRDPALGGATVLPTVLTTGNTDLAPEKADTLTAGFVYEPEWSHGFRMSVDWYTIEIKDAITTLTAQDTIDRCYAGATDLCAQIERNPETQVIEFVTLPFLNLALEKASGIDIELSYLSSLESLNMPGDISIRFLGNYVGEFRRDDGVVESDIAGSLNNGMPSWMWTTLLGYNLRNFNGTVEVNYIGSDDYRNDWDTSIFAENDVSSRTYLNLGLDYTFDTKFGELTAFAAVRNLLDKDPPIQFLRNNSTLYDNIGRYYRAGFRLRF